MQLQPVKALESAALDAECVLRRTTQPELHKKTDARLSFCYACHSGLAEADSPVFYKQLNLWLRVNAHPSENTADDASLFY